MERRWLALVGLVGFAIIVTPRSAVLAQCTLFAAEAADEDESRLMILDPATGLGTPIGDIGAETTGLAFQPLTNVLYGSTAQIVSGTISPRALIRIDQATGAGTEVGLHGTSRPLADLAFDRTTGILYGWQANDSGDLYTVNLMTGAATLVGESGLMDLTGGNGLTFGPGNQLFYAGEGTEGLLRTIDKETGLPISSVQLSGYFTNDNINALAYDGRTIYGVTNNNSDLITINPNTGEIMTIGHAGDPEEDNIDAIEFLCVQASPAAGNISLAVIAAGLLAIGMFYRRARQSAWRTSHAS